MKKQIKLAAALTPVMLGIAAFAMSTAVHAQYTISGTNGVAIKAPGPGGATTPASPTMVR